MKGGKRHQQTPVKRARGSGGSRQRWMLLPCMGFSCPLAPSGAGATAEPPQLAFPWGAETSTGWGQEHQGDLGLSEGQIPTNSMQPVAAVKHQYILYFHNNNNNKKS